MIQSQTHVAPLTKENIENLQKSLNSESQKTAKTEGDYDHTRIRSEGDGESIDAVTNHVEKERVSSGFHVQNGGSSGRVSTGKNNRRRSLNESKQRRKSSDQITKELTATSSLDGEKRRRSDSIADKNQKVESSSKTNERRRSGSGTTDQNRRFPLGREKTEVEENLPVAKKRENDTHEEKGTIDSGISALTDAEKVDKHRGGTQTNEESKHENDKIQDTLLDHTHETQTRDKSVQFTLEVETQVVENNTSTSLDDTRKDKLKTGKIIETDNLGLDRHGEDEQPNHEPTNDEIEEKEIIDEKNKEKAKQKQSQEMNEVDEDDKEKDFEETEQSDNDEETSGSKQKGHQTLDDEKIANKNSNGNGTDNNDSDDNATDDDNNSVNHNVTEEEEEQESEAGPNKPNNFIMYDSADDVAYNTDDLNEEYDSADEYRDFENQLREQMENAETPSSTQSEKEATPESIEKDIDDTETIATSRVSSALQDDDDDEDDDDEEEEESETEQEQVHSNKAIAAYIQDFFCNMDWGPNTTIIDKMYSTNPSFTFNEFKSNVHQKIIF